MVEIEARLTTNLSVSLKLYHQKIRGQVLVSGAAAMARPIYDQLNINVRPPYLGIVSGNLSNAVYRTLSQARSTEDEKAYHVGINRRKAPHWHLIEYGTSKMAPRAPIRRAYQTKRIQSIQAGMSRMSQQIDKL